MEIWKSINENYEISSYGNVKNSKTKNILKGSIDSKGYVFVKLNKKYYKVHRLVAESFIPNPLNLPQVNHKDENKKNNAVENLEWCTLPYNINYGSRSKRVSQSLTNGKTSKCILQFDLNNNLVNEYPSMHEAARLLKIKVGGISMCCRNKSKTAYGFVWRFK